MSQYPRLIWGTSDEYYLDFDDRPRELSTPNQNLVHENESSSGIVEHLEMYDKDLIVAKWTHLNPQEAEILRQFWEDVRDGTTFKFKLDRDLIDYWSFEGKSLVGVNGNEWTHSRTGDCWIENPDTGLVENVASGSAIFPAGKYGRGLQIQSAEDNIIGDHDDFTVGWAATNANVDDNYAYADDPLGNSLGNNTADEINFTVDGGYLRYDLGVDINNNDGNFSVWMKTNEYTFQATINLVIRRDDTHAELASQACTLTGEWVRYECSYNNGGVAGVNWEVEILNDSGTGCTIYAWGAQLTPTRFIKPLEEGGINADSFSITDTIFQPLHLTGSVLFWVKMPMQQSYFTGPKYFIYATESGLSNCLVIGLDSSEKFTAYITEHEAASNIFSCTDSSSDIAANTWTHIAFCWDCIDSKAGTLYVNGSQANQDTNSFSGFADMIDVLRIYHSAGMSFVMDDLIVRSDELTSDEVSWIYDRGRGFGQQKTNYTALMLTDFTHNPFRKLGSNQWEFTLKAREVLS